MKMCNRKRCYEFPDHYIRDFDAYINTNCTVFWLLFIATTIVAFLSKMPLIVWGIITAVYATVNIALVLLYDTISRRKKSFIDLIYESIESEQYRRYLRKTRTIIWMCSVLTADISLCTIEITCGGSLLIFGFDLYLTPFFLYMASDSFNS